MFKFKSSIVAILLASVICSHSILNLTYQVNCNDHDEFAEFDDFATSDSLNQQPKANTKSKQQSIDLGNKFEEPKLPDREVKFSNQVEPGSDNSKADQDKLKKPDLKLVNAPLPTIYSWDSYYVEIGFLIAIIFYLINYFLGSGKNNTFARQFYDRTKDLLRQQFTLVGGSPQLSVANGSKQNNEDDPNYELTQSLKKQKGLIKTSESMYTFWMSGRVGVDGLLIELNLLKRQDLFSMALCLLKPVRDTVTFRFLLNQDGYENFVFCLAHRSWAPKLARDMIDINTFCPKRKPVSQYGINSEKLFIMSELTDVVPFILDQKTNLFLKDYEQSINYIHITDQFSTIKSEDVSPAQRLASAKRMATFSFSLPQNETDRSEFLLFSLALLDRLRRFKLARDSKQKSDKNRQKITDIIEKAKFNQRHEAIQAKKEELRRLEKERIYNEDDPEKQRRWEKKEAKRELKRNKMRVKQLKVKSM